MNQPFVLKENTMKSGTESSLTMNQGLFPKPEMMIRVMADRELERVHQATLTVLEEVGVIC